MLSVPGLAVFVPGVFPVLGILFPVVGVNLARFEDRQLQIGLFAAKNYLACIFHNFE